MTEGEILAWRGVLLPKVWENGSPIITPAVGIVFWGREIVQNGFYLPSKMLVFDFLNVLHESFFSFEIMKFSVMKEELEMRSAFPHIFLVKRPSIVY